MITVASKEEIRSVKKKIDIMKQEIIKQREKRHRNMEKLKKIQQETQRTELQLQKKEDKNQRLLYESRQLKDILIREKQEVNEIKKEIKNIKQTNAGQNSQKQKGGWSWGSYIPGFLKY